MPIRPTPPFPPSARLAGSLSRMAPPVFAVADGGQFEAAPLPFRRAGLAATSLFLGDGTPHVERYGPWCIPLPRPADAEAVLALVGERPAAVFWSCPSGQAPLFDHLRRLNKAYIRAWAAAGKPRPEAGDPAGGRLKAVLFRHWDPRVLGALMPVLDEQQFAQVLGPAAEILFFAPDYGGLRRVLPDPAWPPAPTRSLTVRPDQVDALVDRRIASKRRRLAAYLRDVTGGELAAASDADLHRHVLHSEATARELGIATEAGQCRWTYLMYATRGRAARQADLVDHLRNSRTPDEDLRRIMGEAIKHMRTERDRLGPAGGS